jgi:hypothetical protein
MGQHQLAQRSNAGIGAPDAHDDSKCLGTVCAGNSGLASLNAWRTCIVLSRSPLDMARRLCALQPRIAIGTKVLQASVLRLDKRIYTDVKIVRGRSGRGARGQRCPARPLEDHHLPRRAGITQRSFTHRHRSTMRHRRFRPLPIGSGRYDRFQCRHLNIVQLHISSVCMVQPDGADLCYCLAARRYAPYLGRIYAAI